MKTISAYWALLVGLLTVAAQVIIYYVRFRRWNTDAVFTEYLFFFLAGALGGWILVYFLNRQASAGARWIVLAAFLLASPIALTMMIIGGLVDWPGVLLFPQIPWALFIWLASLGARAVSRAKMKAVTFPRKSR